MVSVSSLGFFSSVRRRIPVRELRNYTWAQADSLVCETLEPIVCRLAFHKWAPVQHWTKEYLAARIGNQSVQVAISACPEFPSLDTSGPDHVTLTIDELLTRLGTSSPPWHYLNGGTTFFNYGTSSPAIAALLDDIRMDEALAPDLLVKSALWISGNGALSRLHFDGNGCHNLNIQVAGQKEFLLVAPSDAAHLQLVDDPANRALSHFSRIENTATDPNNALPAGVSYWHCELNPGDTLVIPALWFHTVRSTGAFNVNVNYWSIAGQGYLGRLLSKLCTQPFGPGTP